MPFLGSQLFKLRQNDDSANFPPTPGRVMSRNGLLPTTTTPPKGVRSWKAFAGMLLAGVIAVVLLVVTVSVVNEKRFNNDRTPAANSALTGMSPGSAVVTPEAGGMSDVGNTVGTGSPTTNTASPASDQQSSSSTGTISGDDSAVESQSVEDDSEEAPKETRKEEREREKPEEQNGIEPTDDTTDETVPELIDDGNTETLPVEYGSDEITDDQDDIIKPTSETEEIDPIVEPSEDTYGNTDPPQEEQVDANDETNDALGDLIGNVDEATEVVPTDEEVVPTEEEN